MSKEKEIKAPFMRSPYNYDVEAASNEAAIPVELNGESMTVQSMAEDADINVLMERFGVTGKMPVEPRVPQYGDFSGITDFRSALHAVQDAQDAFMEYPAALRSRFDNDPQKFLDFCANDKNLDEMDKLGLLKAEVMKERAKVREASVARAQAAERALAEQEAARAAKAAKAASE